MAKRKRGYHFSDEETPVSSSEIVEQIKVTDTSQPGVSEVVETQTVSNEEKEQTNQTGTGENNGNGSDVSNSSETVGAGGDYIDLSQYETAATNEKAFEAQKNALNPKPDEVVKPKNVVVINGRILLGIIGAFAPKLYSTVTGFIGMDYEPEDFKLSDEDTKTLEPAADSCAKRWFADLPDYIQLLLGHAMLSFGNAKLNKARRIYTTNDEG